MTKHEAKAQPGLFFWAEPTVQTFTADLLGHRSATTKRSWIVVGQADGYPASEAHGDWFANEKDANEVARHIAEQYPNH